VSESVLDPQAAAIDPTAAMFDQLMTDDPRLRLFAELMRAQHQASAAEPAEEVLRRLREQHERLRTAYVSLKGRSEQLAAAAGACPNCWGEKSACRYCRGEGTPGAFMPDWELFAQYIMPAVRRRAALTRTTPGGHTANPKEE